MFTLLKERFLQEEAAKQESTIFYIKNGYFEHWNADNQKFSDNGIKAYCTDTRWNQYINGFINRDKLVELTIKRYKKQLEKEKEKMFEHLAAVEAAPELQYININVYWKKSSCYGSHPTATVRTNNGITTGHAGGWGYDKESAAVAAAFNQNNSILKELYKLKEKGLQAGESDKSKTACTGIDNRNICGYGSGYGVIPYFEGGVGVSCFWSILEKCGFKCSAMYGKQEDFYNITK